MEKKLFHRLHSFALEPAIRHELNGSTRNFNTSREMNAATNCGTTCPADKNKWQAKRITEARFFRPSDCRIELAMRESLTRIQTARPVRWPAAASSLPNPSPRLEPAMARLGKSMFPHFPIGRPGRRPDRRTNERNHDTMNQNTIRYSWLVATARSTIAGRPAATWDVKVQQRRRRWREFEERTSDGAVTNGSKSMR